MTDLHTFTAALDCPLYVVTAAAAGERGGCLVGFGSQCSIRPARFIVWLSKANRTYRIATRADRLAVHLLSHDQEHLARLFGGESGDTTDKFARTAWHPGPGGVPVLDEAPVWFVGRVESTVDGGDHVGFLLAPEVSEHPAGDDVRLMFLTDALDISPGHPAD